MRMGSSNAAVASTSDPAEIDASSDGDLADADSQALEYAVYTAYADARSSAGVRRRASSLSSSAVRLQAQVSAPQMGEDIDPLRATPSSPLPFYSSPPIGSATQLQGAKVQPSSSVRGPRALPSSPSMGANAKMAANTGAGYAGSGAGTPSPAHARQSSHSHLRSNTQSHAQATHGHAHTHSGASGL